MEALRAVFAKMGFEIDDSKLKKASANFDQFLSRVRAGTKLFVAARVAGGLITEQIEKGSEIKRLADQFAMTTDEIQKYKYAAEQVGLTTNQMVTAFKILANHMGASTTLTGMQHAIKQFGQYGLSVRDSKGGMKDIPTMLGDIADKMSKMGNAAQRVRFANEMMGEMGFRLIPLLMNGREAVQAFFKDFETLNLSMSERFINASFIAGQRLKMLRTAFQVFKSEVAMGALPALTQIFRRLAEVASNATAVARRTTWMQSAWIAFGVYGVAALVKVAGGVRSLLVLLGRFAWPLALAGLLYLVWDDFYALMNGKKSLIGEVLDEAYGAGTAAQFAERLRDAWRSMGDAVKMLLPDIKELGKWFIDKLPDALTFAADLITAIAAGMEEISAFMKFLIKANDAYFKQRAEGKGVLASLFNDNGYLHDLVSPAGEARKQYSAERNRIWDPARFGINTKPYENRQHYTPGAGALRPGRRGDLPPPAQVHTGNKTVQVTVEGAGDPAQVAEEVVKRTQEIFDDSLNDAAAQGAMFGGL